ncbi:MAG: site-specific integrase [Candidatus Bathyarchaeota archaeon]|nr:site-specific integrase [Candidatus Bathyarchaeota archaeon]
MIERTALAPAITRNRQLSVEELKSLNLPLTFQGDLVIIYNSLTGWKLKKPVIIELKNLLDAKEKGLVDYIIRSCLNDRPGVIPFIFDNQSMLKLARHFLRHLSGSYRSCLTYSVNVKQYATWLGYKPDLIIQDAKPVGAIPDPLKVQNHCAFLNDYLAELQDNDLKPTAVNNCIKAVKTFYHVNGIEVKLNERLPRKVAYKDRAPKPEEITAMIDKSTIREAFIIAALATGGFREGTFCKLKYRHVKEDLEANIVPIHIHVEAQITKGKYHDYDTFLNAEASYLLKMYIADRRRGSRYTPPEEITDDSPLIRSDHNAHKIVGVSEKTLRKIVHTIAVAADVSKKLPDSWMYSVRTHSLRKYFRTQMSASKIDSEIIKYFMGKTIDTYEDVQSLGIETLRNLYTSAGLAIRPKTQVNRIEQLKEIIRAWGQNPEEILTKDALMRGNITELPDQVQSHQLSVLADQLKQLIKREVSV